MAAIKIISGPEEFSHKEIPIPANVRESDTIFTEMSKAGCFWEVNLSGLNSRDSCTVKIMDFSARLARSICMGTPIFVDDQRVIVCSISKKSVDKALRKVITLLLVLDGNMMIAKDDQHALRIKMIPNATGYDFTDATAFASA